MLFHQCYSLSLSPVKYTKVLINHSDNFKIVLFPEFSGCKVKKHMYLFTYLFICFSVLPKTWKWCLACKHRTKIFQKFSIQKPATSAPVVAPGRLVPRPFHAAAPSYSLRLQCNGPSFQQAGIGTKPQHNLFSGLVFTAGLFMKISHYVAINWLCFLKTTSPGLPVQ